MFRRKWSSLPVEAEFPVDLKRLGYFINKDDEVRSIENEDNYFKFFINRNLRICDRQRFAMNQAIQDEIHRRLIGDHGLCKVSLPLPAGQVAPTSANVPIFASAKIKEKSRVVIVFGETHQDLGILAHRILGGKGGIEKGSLVSVVRALLQQHCSPTDAAPPGIILANMGELIWWPEGKRTLSKSAFDATPMRSAAHVGNWIDPKVNYVPCHESPLAHVKYIFERVMPHLVSGTAGLDIIGLGDGADVVESYLNSSATWSRIGSRINCFASVGGQFPVWEVKCAGLQEFLRQRARAFVPSKEPSGSLLSGPSGNPLTTIFTSLGCPVFSAGDDQHVETLFIASYPTVLDWLQEVADASASSGRPYENPMFEINYREPAGENNHWEGLGEKGDGVVGSTEGVEGSDAGVAALKIVTRDDVVETDGVHPDTPAPEETRSDDQLETARTYVIRTKPTDGDEKYPESARA
ncbi:Arb2 domain-containing protein [Nemania abortiva]|nr:Arb2 domain-containing protein [Nemania abortiva]